MQPSTTADFCSDVQHGLASHRVATNNVVYADYEPFKKSKPAIKPLTTHQFVLTEAGDVSRPLRVSCKTKTPDHLRETYGSAQAHDSGRSCRDIHRALVMSVWQAMSPSERGAVKHRPERILLDGDAKSIMGSRWIADYESAYVDSGGQLHLLAKALRVNWNDIWFAWAPNSLRGVHYCHLVAPEHLRRLMLGEVSAPIAADRR